MEELLQESDICIKPSYSQNTSGGSASQVHFIDETTKDSLLLLPPIVRKREDGLSPPRLELTVSSAFLISNVTPQGSYNESCLADQHDSQQERQQSSPNGAIHESVSSGYMSFENVENTAFVSGMIDAGSGICGFSSSEGPDSMVRFFLQSTSNTITNMPEMICPPPVDGEELERSGLELSLCNNFIAEQDICCTSFQDDSATCDSLTAETSESSLLENTESGDDVQSTGKHDLDRDHILDRSEDPVSQSNLCPGYICQRVRESYTIPAPHFCTSPVCSKCRVTIKNGEPVDGAETSKGKVGVNTLLHEDQTDELERNLGHQNSLTAVPSTVNLMVPGAFVKISEHIEQLGSNLSSLKVLISYLESTVKENRENHSQTESEDPVSLLENSGFSDNSELSDTLSTHCNPAAQLHTEHEPTEPADSSVDEAKPSKEPYHMSLEALLKKSHKRMLRNLAKKKKVQRRNQEPKTRPEKQSLSDKENEESPCKGTVTPEEKKTRMIESDFTGKITDVKSESKHLTGDSNTKEITRVEEEEITLKNNKLNSSQEVLTEPKQISAIIQQQPAAVPSTVNLMVPGAFVNISEHIEQLESTLSSLKVLMSDLESTAKENLENHSKTERTTESEFICKGVEQAEQSRNAQHVQLCPNDCDSFEDNLGDADFDSSDSEYRDLPSRQSTDHNKESKEDTGPEPIFSDAEDFSVDLLGKGDESVGSREIRLVKTLLTERGKEKGTGKERLPVNYGLHGSSRMQPPPAKCILSAAQRMHIPVVFRDIPSEIVVPCSASLLSDTSIQSVERRNEMAVEGLNSSQLPSLNKSYDVDTPSDLWLLDGSGSDSGSKSGLVEGKHMTPECRDEGQGRLAKVKRRLLMQTAEDTQGRSPDTNGGGVGRVVRPSSSTPRGSVESQCEFQYCVESAV